MIERVNLFSTEMVGVFAQASNKYVAIPESYSRVYSSFFVERGLDILALGLGGISAVGIMVSLNDNGIVLPYNADDEDIRRAKLLGLNVSVSKARTNALGNLVIANNRVGFVSPRLSTPTIKTVEDALGVELVRMSIAGILTIGSVLSLNNKGFAVHPEASDDEVDAIKRVTGLDGSRTTINGGYPYVRSGIIYNDSIAFVGDRTTGIEMAEIERALAL
jgi:translation initiation factor 6